MGILYALRPQHLTSSGRLFVLYDPKTNLRVPVRLLSRTEFRRFIFPSREITESLWEEFFQDPSKFYDIRNTKKNHTSPDYKHKQTGKALWIDGISNPAWVRTKLQSIELQDRSERGATIQLIKSCGKEEDITSLISICTDKPWITDDIYIANTLIRYLAKCGAVTEARKVFDQLVERNVASWNALIAGYADQGFGEQALACFREMENNKVIPDSVTYVSSLSACAVAGDLETVKEIHSHLTGEGLLIENIVLGNSLVNAYAKCGALNEAKEVFDQLCTKANVVTWNALITGYVEHGFGKEAIACFKDMEKDRVQPDAVTYACILTACATVGSLKIVVEIHGQVTKLGLTNKNLVLGTALVNAYAKCGVVKEAQKVFDQLAKRNIVSWNSLISGYVEHGFGEEVVRCFWEIVSDGVAPDLVTYACTLKACATIGALQMVKEIHSRVKEHGLLNKEIVLVSALVNSYARCGAVKEAREVFNLVSKRNVVSWNALISGYAEQGFGEEAITCFREMENDSINPNSVTYTCCLTACATVGSLDMVREIHTRVRDQGLLNKHVVLGNALLNAYAKCGAVMEAQEVFDLITVRNVVSWNSLIAGYAEQGFGEAALKCFRMMGNDGMAPDSATYASTLKACAILGALDVIKEIHGQVRDEGLLNEHIDLGTALVNAYVKCGAVKEAREVFNRVAERNALSWNAILGGYAQLGQLNEILQLFNRIMAEGVFLDHVTFLVLLNLCSHRALLEEGEQLFYMMGICGLALTPEHYTCMVDMFGRAGQLDKAKWFVLERTQTLLAFLSACKKWANVELGRWAFQKLLHLDQNCPSSYVCMSNMYAAAGMVKEADEIEFLRVNQKGKGSVNSYMVSVKSHIYSKLEETMMKGGHSLDWHWVSRSIPYHRKEKTLFGHNEKLAIACALMIH